MTALPFPTFDPETMELEDITDEVYWEGFSEFIATSMKSQGRFITEAVARWVTSEAAIFDEDPDEGQDSLDPILDEVWGERRESNSRSEASAPGSQPGPTNQQLARTPCDDRHDALRERAVQPIYA